MEGEKMAEEKYSDEEYKSVIEEIVAVKSLLRTERNGNKVEVLKGSQYLGDFTHESDNIIIARKVGESGVTRKNFTNESEALDWITKALN